MSPEIFALLAPLPAKVKAVTVTDDNITFTIVISEYLCERSREAALNHELNHIYENHFTDQAIPIALAERLADEIRKPRALVEPCRANLFRRAGSDDTAVIEHNKVLANSHDKAHIVLNEQNRDMETIANQLDRLHELRRLRRVHTGRRFIKQ